MRLIFIGPPGSGKGTQAKNLSVRNNLEHIATGNLLRTAVDEQTPVGMRASPYLTEGRLVPDEVVNDIIADRFRREDRPQRFVMDGYPRTPNQARAFDEVLREYNLPLTAVLILLVDDAELIRRLSARWNCPNTKCQHTYHLPDHPPKVKGICDHCGSRLFQRDDDKEETVKARLRVYHGETAGIIPYYRSQGLVKEVRGIGDKEEIYQNLVRAVQG